MKLFPVDHLQVVQGCTAQHQGHLEQRAIEVNPDVITVELTQITSHLPTKMWENQIHSHAWKWAPILKASQSWELEVQWQWQWQLERVVCTRANALLGECIGSGAFLFCQLLSVTSTTDASRPLLHCRFLTTGCALAM